VLLAAFGIGVWLSAQGSRSLRVIGAVMIVPAATIPLWMIFGEASIAAHLALVGVGILCWLVAMGLGAAALGKRFRIYSLVSLGWSWGSSRWAFRTYRRPTQGNQHRS